jgi:hypothetical protein
MVTSGTVVADMSRAELGEGLVLPPIRSEEDVGT